MLFLRKGNLLWKENLEEKEETSVVYIYVCFNKTATTLKCSALGVYPVLAVFLNFTIQILSHIEWINANRLFACHLQWQ